MTATPAGEAHDTNNATPEPELFTKFDADPEAIAWARARVKWHIDRMERMSKSPSLDAEAKRGWKKAVNMAKMDLMGPEADAELQGCVIAAFDLRRPTLVKIYQKAEDEERARTGKPRPSHWDDEPCGD